MKYTRSTLLVSALLVLTHAASAAPVMAPDGVYFDTTGDIQMFSYIPNSPIDPSIRS